MGSNQKYGQNKRAIKKVRKAAKNIFFNLTMNRFSFSRTSNNIIEKVSNIEIKPMTLIFNKIPELKENKIKLYIFCLLINFKAK